MLLAVPVPLTAQRIRNPFAGRPSALALSEVEAEAAPAAAAEGKANIEEAGQEPKIIAAAAGGARRPPAGRGVLPPATGPERA